MDESSRLNKDFDMNVVFVLLRDDVRIRVGRFKIHIKYHYYNFIYMNGT